MLLGFPSQLPPGVFLLWARVTDSIPESPNPAVRNPWSAVRVDPCPVQRLSFMSATKCSISQGRVLYAADSFSVMLFWLVVEVVRFRMTAS